MAPSKCQSATRCECSPALTSMGAADSSSGFDFRHCSYDVVSNSNITRHAAFDSGMLTFSSKLSIMSSSHRVPYPQVMKSAKAISHQSWCMFVASMEQKRHRSRDFGLYVAIGTLVAVLAMGYGVYMAKAGKPLVFKNDWSVTIATAGLVFGYAIKEHWPQRRMKKFWAAWVGLLVAHF